MSDKKVFLIFLGVFLLFWFLPVESIKFQNAIIEAFALTKWYAREHVLLCLIPAFFIAGAIAVFVSKESVMRYFGPRANKILSYSVASVSGTILAVCSCTVLPLFAGIYSRGAGIGPATAFLYSGPAINVLAIILTARILGLELGLARALGAVLFSIIIGLSMYLIFGDEKKDEDDQNNLAGDNKSEERSLSKNVIYFAVMVGILVFANWGKDESIRLWQMIYNLKWVITAVLLVCLGIILVKWFRKDELIEWTYSTWDFAKQILPLLFIGVFVAGFFLGRPGHEALIPNEWVVKLVGGNSIWANLFASLSGALMYFATLTEIPILQGLIGSGMGKGPALALLLSGPAVSLPSMLVLRSIMGTKKTAVYILLVIFYSTISGFIYGSLF